MRCPDPTPELSEPTQRPDLWSPSSPALGRVTGRGSSLTTPPPHRPVPWPPSLPWGQPAQVQHRHRPPVAPQALIPEGPRMPCKHSCVPSPDIPPPRTDAGRGHRGDAATTSLTAEPVPTTQSPRQARQEQTPGHRRPPARCQGPHTRGAPEAWRPDTAAEVTQLVVDGGPEASL